MAKEDIQKSSSIRSRAPAAMGVVMLLPYLSKAWDRGRQIN